MSPGERAYNCPGVPMIPDALINKFASRDGLTDEEKDVIAGLVDHVRTVPARQDIIAQQERVSSSTLLLDGLAARYKVLSDGRRQITSFHVPGDFVDLHGFLLHKLDHGVLAVSPCELAVVSHGPLMRITETQPHLTRLLWLDTLVDAAVHREWLVAMGQMDALGHSAHLLCEMYVRLKQAGRAQDHTFSLPITQEEFADALGVSSVHVNRSIQELRGMGLITWKGKIVTIHDWGRLVEVGEFDPTYLSLTHEPR